MLKFSEFLNLQEDVRMGGGKPSITSTYKQDMIDRINVLKADLVRAKGNPGEEERIRSEINQKQREFSNMNVATSVPDSTEKERNTLPEPGEEMKMSAYQKFSGTNIPGEVSRPTSSDMTPMLPSVQTSSATLTTPTKIPSMSTETLGRYSKALRL